MFLRFIVPAIAVIVFAQQPALASNRQAQGKPGQAQALPQEIKQKLTSQGFRNVKVVPGSYIISARDTEGDPVSMVIKPNSVSMFTVISPSAKNKASSASTASVANANKKFSSAKQTGTVPQQIAQKLGREDFTDISINPGSFLISANDRDGEPVDMVIGPRSITMFTAVP